MEQPAYDCDEADEHQRENEEERHGDRHDVPPGHTGRFDLQPQGDRPARRGALPGGRSWVPIRLKELEVPGVRLEGDVEEVPSSGMAPMAMSISTLAAMRAATVLGTL